VGKYIGKGSSAHRAKWIAFRIALQPAAAVAGLLIFLLYLGATRSRPLRWQSVLVAAVLIAFFMAARRFSRESFPLRLSMWLAAAWATMCLFMSIVSSALAHQEPHVLDALVATIAALLLVVSWRIFVRSS